MSSNFFKNILTDKSLTPTWWGANLDWIFDDKNSKKPLDGQRDQEERLPTTLTKIFLIFLLCKAARRFRHGLPLFRL